MKEIGGYFELELNRNKEFHNKAISLNLGRSALEYVLKAKKVKRIFLPYYICQALLETVKRARVLMEFYPINENLEPVFDFSSLDPSDYFLYVNYFGIKESYIAKKSGSIKNLIIDNSQAFFSNPLPGADTFYSPRKFFGVPDGGYLYTDTTLVDIIEQDISWKRMRHLIIRHDRSAKAGYGSFLKNENELNGQPIKTMSEITHSLLGNIDYNNVRNTRNENFMFLHNTMHKQNELSLDNEVINAPMVYPFLCADGMKRREKLIKHKIYVASYWENVIKTVRETSLEVYLAKNLLPLPIDQRYSVTDLKNLLQII